MLAARQLALERDRLAQLFEQAPIFMALLQGPTHRIEIANPAYLQLVGHRPVLGKTVAEALPEAASQGYVALLDAVFATGTAYRASGAKYRSPAGPGGPTEKRFVDFVYQPINDADKRVTGIFVVGADVTERTLVFAALGESEARIPVRPEGRTDGLLGDRPRDQYADLVQGSDGTCSASTWPTAEASVGGPNDEYVPRSTPTIATWCRASTSSPRNRIRSPRSIGSYDPTASRSGCQAAARSPARRRRQAAAPGQHHGRRHRGQAGRGASCASSASGCASPCAPARWAPTSSTSRSDTLWWSPETYELFGVSPTDFVPTRASVLALLHPDDRDGFATRRGEAIARAQPFFDEFRVKRADGSHAWIDYRGQAEYDAEGRPVRTFGVVSDMTERKQIEQALRQADQREGRLHRRRSRTSCAIRSRRSATPSARCAGSIRPTRGWPGASASSVARPSRWPGSSTICSTSRA